MPKVSAAHMQSRREQIVRAAIAEFSANGIHSTSMAAIIAASGLSAGAIYTHFSGKDKIIAFASQTAISGVFAGVEHALKDLPPQNEAAIFQLITAGINEAAVSPGFIVQVWAEATTNPEVRGTAAAAYAEALRFLSEYLSRGAAPESSPDLSDELSDELSSGPSGHPGVGDDAGAPPRAHEALPRARSLLALVYAHIVQRAVLTETEGGASEFDVAAVFES